MTAERMAVVRAFIPLEDIANYGRPIQDRIEVLGKVLMHLDSSEEGEAVAFAMQRLGGMLFSVQCGQYVEESGDYEKF